MDRFLDDLTVFQIISFSLEGLSIPMSRMILLVYFGYFFSNIKKPVHATLLSLCTMFPRFLNSFIAFLVSYQEHWDSDSVVTWFSVVSPLALIFALKLRNVNNRYFIGSDLVLE